MNRDVKMLLVDDDPGDLRLAKLALTKATSVVKPNIETADSLAEVAKAQGDTSE